jgi:uncharacterized protein (DUF488 family)|nr:MAG TPA: protein of unknown function DUF488 [Caudoviricetes sp.]
MLYYRRKILLALLEVFGGNLTAKSIQKYLFLFTRKQEVKAFDFLPYRYGCFSFQANQDIVTLSKYGYLEIVEHENGRHIHLLKKGNYASMLELFDNQLLFDTKLTFGSMTQNELIRYTYVTYPFYAIRSSIAEKILSTDELDKVKAQERRIDEQQLFTIGYEGKTLEKYIVSLILKDVHVLCDVRKNAFSQKYGFSKSQLQKACEGVGIRYVHIPELGIESEQRQDLRSQADYDLLFDRYEKTVLQFQATYLGQIKELVDTYQRVALTCFEKNPLQCHRSRVAKHVMLLPGVKFKLTDIL